MTPVISSTTGVKSVDIVDASITAADIAASARALLEDNVFNVKDAAYGAAGDGSTNDTAAINSAITAAVAATNSGTNFAEVLFPPGIYMADNLTVSSPFVRLRGPGTIKRRANGDLLTVSADNVEVVQLGLDCNGASFTGNGITSSGNDLRVDSCRIFGVPTAAGYCVQFTAAQKVRRWITGNYLNIIGTPARGCIGFEGTTQRTVTDGAITSGQPTLTSATAAFTAGDVNKSVTVVGAGAAGATLSTTISAFVNATTVTLAANAGTTVTNASTLIELTTLNGDSNVTGNVCAGSDLADLSGCATVLLDGANQCRNIFFDQFSKKVNLIGNRLATSGADTTVLGTEHVINGNTHAGGFVLGAGTTGCKVGPNVEAIHDTTDSSGSPGSNTIITSNNVGALRVYDRDNGQAGIIVPGYVLPSSTATLTLTAGRAYITRFRPTSPMTAASIGFNLVTPAGANDNCDVAILDSAYKVLRTSGSTAGKLNATGNSVQTVSLSSTLSLTPGTTYHAVLSVVTPFGGTAAALSANNLTNPLGDLWGTGAGIREVGAQSGVGVPINTNGTLAPAQSPQVPYLFITG